GAGRGRLRGAARAPRAQAGQHPRGGPAGGDHPRRGQLVDGRARPVPRAQAQPVLPPHPDRDRVRQERAGVDPRRLRGRRGGLLPQAARRAPPGRAGVRAGGRGAVSRRPAIDPAAAPELVARLLEAARAETDRELDRRLPLPDLPAADPARRLVEAMRYAALAPGKRLRPALVIAACEAAGGARADALPAAAAIELLHCYTLVHDDLPAMDDDDERRGRPTVHRAFDEATAILAGDGLVTAAFGALADLGAGAAAAVAVLAARSGHGELLAGQALDLAAAGGGAGGAPRTLAEVERIHAGKTGALFAASAELGAIAAGASLEVRG